MHFRPLVAAALVTVAAASCANDHGPLSGSPDVVARTVGHDLTVARMSTLLGRGGVRLDPRNAMAVATLWASYERLAFAAAHGDTLSSHMAAAITPPLNGERIGTLLSRLARSMRSDSATQAAYDSAALGLYAVRHLLVAYPANPTARQVDSVRSAAVALRRLITPANFEQLARQRSGEAQSAARGGYLGVFPKTAMNPAAATAVAALKPDSISRLLPTPQGIDIIQRLSWADAKHDYAMAFARAEKESHDSVLRDRAAAEATLVVTSGAPDVVRAAATNPIAGSVDSTTVATFDRGGKVTASDLLAWIGTMQPSLRVQVLSTIPLESDSVLTTFIRNGAARAVLLRAADSAGITAPDSLTVQFRTLFFRDVETTWRALGIAPAQLADSAKTPGEREQLAARRVESILERGLSGHLQLPPISVPVEAALNRTYEAAISSDALARAVDAARALRVTDSARIARPKAATGAGAPKPPPRS